MNLKDSLCMKEAYKVNRDFSRDLVAKLRP